MPGMKCDEGGEHLLCAGPVVEVAPTPERVGISEGPLESPGRDDSAADTGTDKHRSRSGYERRP